MEALLTMGFDGVATSGWGFSASEPETDNVGLSPCDSSGDVDVGSDMN